MSAIMQQIREEGRIEVIMEMYHDEKISLSTACTYLGITEEQFLEEEKKYNN